LCSALAYLGLIWASIVTPLEVENSSSVQHTVKFAGLVVNLPTPPTSPGTSPGHRPLKF
jgi:hypothetical protein